MSDKLMLILNVPPGLQENLVDWLLEDNRTGFTSSMVFGHSSNIKNYNLTEQVTGRQKRVEFQVISEGDGIDSLLKALREEFHGTGVHYWIVPVIDEGRL